MGSDNVAMSSVTRCVDERIENDETTDQDMEM